MKKLIFTASVLLLTGMVASAQTPVKDDAHGVPTVTMNSATPASTSLAEMVFETDIHDFGTIEYAGVGTYEFKFKNTGKEPLIISNAKGSCGCTVPTYPKDKPIKPGESEVIKVTYDTKRPGNFTKTVTITSNAKTGEKVITIKGVVQAAAVEEALPTNGKRDDGATPLAH